MTRKSTKKLNIFLSIFITIMLITTGYIFSMFSFKNTRNTVDATNNQSVSVSIKNGNFENSSTSSYPKKPSDWTACDIDNPSIVSGIISLETNLFNQNKTEKYKLNSNISSLYAVSGSDDDNVLMINNTSNTSAHYYYTSSDISLDANCFYVISIYGKCYNSTLNIGLSNTDKTIDLSYTQGNSSWTNFEFYVATSTLESDTVNLKVALGTSAVPQTGTVFFDYSQCKKISHNAYEEATSAQKVSLREDNFINDRITNQNFSTNTGWTLNKASASSKIYNISPTDTHNNLSTNTKCYKLVTNGIKEYLTLTSDEFILKQQEILKISFWAKTDCTSKATLKATDIVSDNESINISMPEDVTLTISTDIGETNNGGWKEYHFIASGHPWGDTSLQLIFSLGEEDTTTEGSFMINDITVQQLTTSQQEDAESLANTTTLKTESFTTPTIANGFFNIADEIKYDNKNVIFPISPASWTISSTGADTITESNYLGGIISTNPTVFANSGLTGISNPEKTPAQELSDFNINNVLLLKNKNLTDLIAKSSTLSMSASSYYEVKAYIQTQGGGIASMQIEDNSIIFAQKSNISNSNWTLITFYIKTSTYSLAPVVQFAQTNSNGCVFIDDVSLITSTEEDFSDALVSGNSNNIIIDLSQENFNIVSKQYKGSLKQSTAPNAEELTIAKIYDTTSGEIPNLSSVGSADGDGKVLLISSLDTVHYEFTSANSYAVDANQYYKLSIFCKVKNLQRLTGEYGANIVLTNLSEGFYNIKQESSSWTEYAFFINPTSTTNFKIVLSLGGEDSLTRGYALFDKITFEKLDENAFDTEYNTSKMGGANVVKVANIETEETPAIEETESETTSNFNWLWIPSLVLGIALIIVVIVITARNIKITSPKGKKIKNEYDKDQINKKEQRKKRKQKLIDFMTTEDENENK